MATDALRFEEPGFPRWLFASAGAAWIWLVVRVYFGYQWPIGVGQGEHPAWMSSGEALRGFATFASAELTQGDHPPVNYGWYAAFLRWIAGDAYPWLAKLIAVGELTIGILLILGLFTGIAAFLGGTLTMSFGLAGSAGVNPMFFLFEVLLILAWRNAGYIGLDRWVLPVFGTPWEPGPLVRRLAPEREEEREVT